MTRARRRSKAEKDPVIFEVLIAVVRIGAGQAAACEQAGISQETLRTYVRRGTAGEEPFASWLVEFEKARSGPRVYCLEVLHRAATADWRAAAWLLEKLYPYEFGALRGTPTPAPTRPQFDLAKLSVEELFELKRLSVSGRGV
ncbi:MAG: hypothetical protein EVA89_11060 [Sandaracinaceae bacterium]|nr:MAG: hypothetical protein EVA89_11060 [Sandaracinaceae bacterium]